MEEDSNTLSSAIELRIFKQEDRRLVAGILSDNGYTVRQSKKLRSPTSKCYDYIITAIDDRGVSTNK